MPDIYADIASADPEVQATLADAMVTRAADADMIAMRHRYFKHLDLQPGAFVADIGCGPGDVTRDLMETTRAGRTVGLDRSPVMIDRARQRHSGVERLEFVTGDARDLPFGDGELDAAVFHTCLCHVPGPERALAEVFRVLRSAGRLAIFDGDYATTTAALADRDPVNVAVEHAIANLVHDRWLMRSMASHLVTAGFEIERSDAHPYQPDDLAYFFTLVDRGTQFMERDGILSGDAARTIRSEARSRAAADRFFGFILFVSLIATKPA
jgi:SAM-dependent methyltransferase